MSEPREPDELDDPACQRLRSFCGLLPETAEIDGMGHPTFRVATKPFAVYEVIDGHPSVCVKLDLAHQAEMIGNVGITLEPDTGHHGWTRLDAGTMEWDAVDALVLASYRLVAPAHCIVELDALLDAPE